MISMVESPTRFFVQKAGSLSKDLDCLIEDITDFYSNNDNRLQYTAIKVCFNAVGPLSMNPF